VLGREDCQVANSDWHRFKTFCSHI